MGRLAKVMQGQHQNGLKAYKHGGAVKCNDAAEDKAMVKKMMKPATKKYGGKVKK